MFADFKNKLRVYVCYQKKILHKNIAQVAFNLKKVAIHSFQSVYHTNPPTPVCQLTVHYKL